MIDCHLLQGLWSHGQIHKSDHFGLIGPNIHPTQYDINPFCAPTKAGRFCILLNPRSNPSLTSSSPSWWKVSQCSCDNCSTCPIQAILPGQGYESPPPGGTPIDFIMRNKLRACSMTGMRSDSSSICLMSKMSALVNAKMKDLMERLEWMLSFQRDWASFVREKLRC